ncbi:carboxypeptidase regulator [Burkholderia singularis]|uniref:Carboxypeptidase regulator n=1 Tax=Burkholderia singularis TaxID=1503053 RepID=A0A103DVU3_9BURK|nr:MULTISPECIES: carboxypeptidase regulatory-like domain-containing protein [Burkholderia]AOK30494.1 carboxypeptidase regulator [Burkholderia sp. Bp7605]KVE23658.1 carboxypeptidase regulator [Burkholderia singularis]SMG00380.1 putative exported protein [Burkholderia singularis]
MRQQAISRYLAAAALTFGIAGAAFAQSGLPDVQRQGNVSFVSGGVGQDESSAFQRNERRWPLALRFTGAGGEFLADVRVSVRDARGREVLAADARGPYMLVRLAPGRYTIRAAYNGNEQTRTVAVPAKGGAKVAFSWRMQ